MTPGDNGNNGNNGNNGKNGKNGKKRNYTYEYKYKKNCCNCGKSFMAKSAGAFYCSSACKRFREEERRLETKLLTIRKEKPLPEFVPVAYEILSIQGGMSERSLRVELKKRGFVPPTFIANIMDAQGYLLYEDDDGKLHPFERKNNESKSN